MKRHLRTVVSVTSVVVLLAGLFAISNPLTVLADTNTQTIPFVDRYEADHDKAIVATPDDETEVVSVDDWDYTRRPRPRPGGGPTISVVRP